MSKRGSTGFGGDEERYGIVYESRQTDEDPPQKATAAQLARRKIASLKKPGARGRSGSPAVMPQTNGSNVFGQSSSQPQQQQSQTPFAANSFGFSFGGQPQAQAQDNTSTFQFGVSVPAPSQQNGDSNNPMFGQSTPTFPSFNAGSTQSTTNGFNPSTSSIFAQPPQTNSTPSFGGFGATQQNGATPATTTSSTFGSFGQNQTANGTGGLLFGAQQKQNEPETPSNPFSSFSAPQKEAEKPTTTTFGGFGATQQEKEKSATPFGGAAQQVKPASTPFAGFGAPQQEKEPSRASTPFGGFGATQPEKPGSSLGSGIFGQKQQANSDKPSTLFGQSQTNGDKSSNLFAGFGQKQTESSDKAAALGNADGDKSSQEKKSTAAPTGMFGGFGGAQTNGESTPAQGQEPKKPVFGFGQSQAASKPEQPTSNLFSQPSQPNGEKTGLFGASATPFNMPKSGGSVFDSLPKKDLSNGGKPLFSSADPSQIFREDEEEKANDDATSASSNIFGQSQQKSSMFGASQPSKPTSNLFQTPSMSTSQQDTSMITPSSDAPKNLFASINQAGTSNAPSTTPAPTRSLFDRIDKDDMAKRMGGQEDSTKATETPKAPTFGFAPQTPAAVKPLFQPASTTSSLFQKPTETSEAQAPKDAPAQGWLAKARQANAPFTPAPPAAPPVSFKAPPATAPPTRMAPPPQSSALSTVVSASDITDSRALKLKELNEGMIGHLNTQDPDKDWTSIFQYYMKATSTISGTPLPAEATAPILEPTRAIEAPPATGNLFSQATPSTTSGVFGTQTPTAQTSSSIFSKPPSTAPPASKKRAFEQDEDSAAQPPATEKRVKPNESISYPKLPENASSTSRMFAAALDKSKSVDTSKSATSSGFTPSTKPLFPASTGGFVPKSVPAAAGTNFLASFGKVAKDEEEKERKKRKAEDYDSEDEDEEAWEKRDREEQEAKRKKLSDASQSGSGFSLQAPNEPPKTPAFKLGSVSAASTTPAIPPPKFSFGSSSQTTTEPGKLAPPASTPFGPASSSVEASRATTPGAATDGEASAAADDGGEPSDEPNMAQGEDHNALQAVELEANDILMEISNAVIRKFDKVEGEAKAKFSPIGEGRVYVLKDKTSGKTRIMSRVGLGRVVLNFNPQPKMTYTVHSTRENLVICDFIDHINFTPAKFGRFYITTESKDEAKELARLLTEGRPQ